MGTGSSVNSRAGSVDSQIRATATNGSNQRGSVRNTHQTNTATDRRREDTAASIASTRVEDDLNRTSMYSNSSHGNVSGTSSNNGTSQLIPNNGNSYHTNSQTQQMTTGNGSDPTNNVERVTTTPHTHSEEGERIEERDSQRRSISEQSTLIQETPHSPPLHSNTSSLLQRRHGDFSITQHSSRVIVPTATEHINIIKTSLELLAKEFGVYFNMDNMVSSAIVFTTEPLNVIVNVGSDPMGVYIVYDEEYSYSNNNGGIVLGELYQGDMFGEVACLMNVKNTMCVKCGER